MWLLNIFDNQTLELIAETGAIVIGSLLMGILLGYLYWGEFKKKSIKLSKSLDLERDQALQNKEKMEDLEATRNHLQAEMQSDRSKFSSQSKTIYDQQLRIFETERQIQDLSTTIGQLNQTIETYEQRMNTIKDEIEQPQEDIIPIRKIIASPSRINYEYVSNLLGRQVIEDDLTLIVGIGPRTSALLESHGIETWQQLANTSTDQLQQILSVAGGIYKSLDPTHWAKQAGMASQSEWRKLRVYQESIRKLE